MARFFSKTALFWLSSVFSMMLAAKNIESLYVCTESLAGMIEIAQSPDKSTRRLHLVFHRHTCATPWRILGFLGPETGP